MSIVISYAHEDNDFVDHLATNLFREFTHIPVIVASALNTAEDKGKCLKLGANDYIAKPFAVGEFVTRFKAVFG